MRLASGSVSTGFFLSVEAKDLAVLSGQSVHVLCLILIHKQCLLAFEKFISCRAGNECRGLAVVFLPNILSFLRS